MKSFALKKGLKPFDKNEKNKEIICKPLHK